MNLNLLTPAKSLNKAYYKQSLNRDQIELFKAELSIVFNHTDEKQDEEYHKNLISRFLLNVYCNDKYLVNVNKRQDLVIRVGNKTDDEVGVILEFKKPTEKRDMVSSSKPNVKALQELVLYYLREAVDNDNHKIKYLIATNIHEWFIFNEVWFEKNIFRNAKLIKDYQEWKVSGHDTKHFYDHIASKHLAAIDGDVDCTYFNLKDFQKVLEKGKQKDDNRLIDLYKILSPEFLLKKPFANDSNTLNKEFYNELLHILGLEEKSGLIGRLPDGRRHEGSLLENTVLVLKRMKYFGYDESEEIEYKYFDLALELGITWLNRILFLKLLEGQLTKYHKLNKESYLFLNINEIKDFDELDELFFDVLAVPQAKRTPAVNKKYGNIPYLNSSLFEPTEHESKYNGISQLKDRLGMPIYSNTVLKDHKGKRIAETKLTLQYLLEFLDAYNFASDGSADIQEENKTIINASVLGLIFEKINGYQDGSFFTPGFITMYMCRETIRRAVVQKFNFERSWSCKSFDELKDKIEYSDKVERKKANTIINSLRICDPSVGSGHFLVSALNELISIKGDLHILNYRDGSRIDKDYKIQIENDELIITDKETDKPFEYTLHDNGKPSEELQKLQEAIFHEKQFLIENCLFGVDINPKSVNICRLRLWIELLKHAYYTESSKYQQLETLPNIDINIKCGDSLISKFRVDFEVSHFRNQKIRGKFLEEFVKYSSDVEKYKECREKKEKDEIKKRNRKFQDFLTQQYLGDHKLFVEIKELESKLGEQKFDFDFIDSQDEKTEQLKVIQQKRSEFLAHFHEVYDNALEWRFDFPEIQDSKANFKGFDVIIGNPPYIGQKGNKEIFQNIKETYLGEQYHQRRMDLFYFFFHLGLLNLREGGILGFITTNYYLTATYSDKLREHFYKDATILGLINFNELKLFESALGQHNLITILKKGKDDSIPASTSMTRKTGFADNAALESILYNHDEETDYYVQPQTQLYEKDTLYIRIEPEGKLGKKKDIYSILNEIKEKGELISTYCEIEQGIVSGADKVSDSHIKDYPSLKIEKGEGIYVLTKKEVDKLELTNAESAYFKKTYKNSAIKKWLPTPDDSLYVLYIKSTGEYLDLPEKIRNHLNRFKLILVNRNVRVGTITEKEYEDFVKNKKDISYIMNQSSMKKGNFYCISYARRGEKTFEQPKIVNSRRSKLNIFALEEKGYYEQSDIVVTTIKPEWKDKISLYYLLGLLNSKLYYRWFYHKGKRKGEMLEIFQKPLSEVPVKYVELQQQEPIIKLVKQVISAKKKSVKADVSDLENEIDRLVFELYGIDSEGQKIVENIN